MESESALKIGFMQCMLTTAFANRKGTCATVHPHSRTFTVHTHDDMALTKIEHAYLSDHTAQVRWSTILHDEAKLIWRRWIRSTLQRPCVVLKEEEKQDALVGCSPPKTKNYDVCFSFVTPGESSYFSGLVGKLLWAYNVPVNPNTHSHVYVEKQTNNNNKSPLSLCWLFIHHMYSMIAVSAD